MLIKVLEVSLEYCGQIGHIYVFLYLRLFSKVCTAQWSTTVVFIVLYKYILIDFLIDTLTLQIIAAQIVRIYIKTSSQEFRPQHQQAAAYYQYKQQTIIWGRL